MSKTSKIVCVIAVSNEYWVHLKFLGPDVNMSSFFNSNGNSGNYTLTILTMRLESVLFLTRQALCEFRLLDPVGLSRCLYHYHHPRLPRGMVAQWLVGWLIDWCECLILPAVLVIVRVQNRVVSDPLQLFCYCFPFRSLHQWSGSLSIHCSSTSSSDRLQMTSTVMHAYASAKSIRLPWELCWVNLCQLLW